VIGPVSWGGIEDYRTICLLEGPIDRSNLPVFFVFDIWLSCPSKYPLVI
jgi:hypothetical protein